MRRSGLSLLISVVLHIALLIALWAFRGEREMAVRGEGLKVELMRRERPRVGRKVVLRRAELMPRAPAIAFTGGPLASAGPFRPTAAFKPPPTEWKDGIAEASEETGIDLPTDLGRGAGEAGEMRRPSPGRAVSVGRPLPSEPAKGSASAAEPRGIGGDPLITIADALIRSNRTGKLDLIFLVDSSGTMRPHILKVALKLLRMAERIRRAEVELRVGVLKFSRIEGEDLFESIGPTGDVEEVRRFLTSIRCLGDERAKDALMEAFKRARMRKGADKAFVLVTDERMKGRADIDTIIAKAKEEGVRVYVLGVEDEEQIRLTRETGGMWFPIEGD